MRNPINRPNAAIKVTNEVYTGPPLSPHKLRPQIPVGVSNMVMECVKIKAIERPSDMRELISRLDLLIHMIAGGKLSTNNNSEK